MLVTEESQKYYADEKNRVYTGQIPFILISRTGRANLRFLKSELWLPGGGKESY